MALARVAAVALLCSGCVFDSRGMMPPRVDREAKVADRRIEQPDRGQDAPAEAGREGPLGPCLASGPACRLVSGDGGTVWQAGDCQDGDFVYRRSCQGGSCAQGVCLKPDHCVDCKAGCPAGEVCSAFAGVQPGGNLVVVACCAKKEPGTGEGNGATPCQADPKVCATGLCTSTSTCFEACTRSLSGADSCPPGRACQPTEVLEGGKAMKGYSCRPSPADGGVEAGRSDALVEPDAPVKDLSRADPRPRPRPALSPGRASPAVI